MWKQREAAAVSGFGPLPNGRMAPQESNVRLNDVARYYHPVGGVVVEGTVAEIRRTGPGPDGVFFRLHPVALVPPNGQEGPVYAADFNMPPDTAGGEPGALFPADALVLHRRAGSE